MKYHNNRKFQLSIVLLVFLSLNAVAQIQDDFEGNGTITNWAGDDCNINITAANPFQQGVNTSATVMEYGDVGGQYANVRFQQDDNFDLSSNSVFSLKVYVPSNSVTGGQNNQISLKLQNGSIDSPWETQSEIIKLVVLDEWQTVTFDFVYDNYMNFNPGSPAPSTRTDFNRVVIQVNGENNNDLVTAYIDEILNEGNGTPPVNQVYDFLVWSDEFDTDGAVNASKWHHQTIIPDGGSWFNGEIQHYTNRIENSYVSNGILNIEAIRGGFTDQNVTKQFTSARLNSKFAFTYGKVEVRAQLPSGVGTWPAIWTLGKNITENGGYWNQQGFGTTGWPACGEIDIMEHWGNNQNFVQSATHTPSSFGNTINHGGQGIATASSEFHIYTLEWFPDKMVFSVDGVQHYTYEPSVYNNDTWPFTADQYILLNFAILPEIAPSFNQDILKIDYVRVYQSNPTSTESVVELNDFNLKNTPNPASDQTVISYNLKTSAPVNLSVYDYTGRHLKTLINEEQSAGLQQVIWDVNNLQAGLYFYTVKVGEQIITKKCVVE